MHAVKSFAVSKLTEPIANKSKCFLLYYPRGRCAWRASLMYGDWPLGLQKLPGHSLEHAVNWLAISPPNTPFLFKKKSASAEKRKSIYTTLQASLLCVPLSSIMKKQTFWCSSLAWDFSLATDKRATWHLDTTGYQGIFKVESIVWFKRQANTQSLDCTRNLALIEVVKQFHQNDNVVFQKCRIKTSFSQLERDLEWQTGKKQNNSVNRGYFLSPSTGSISENLLTWNRRKQQGFISVLY